MYTRYRSVRTASLPLSLSPSISLARSLAHARPPPRRPAAEGGSRGRAADRAGRASPALRCGERRAGASPRGGGGGRDVWRTLGHLISPDFITQGGADGPHCSGRRLAWKGRRGRGGGGGAGRGPERARVAASLSCLAASASRPASSRALARWYRATKHTGSCGPPPGASRAGRCGRAGGLRAPNCAMRRRGARARLAAQFGARSPDDNSPRPLRQDQDGRRVSIGRDALVLALPLRL